MEVLSRRVPAHALTVRVRSLIWQPMGVLRSPHEATCPSIASRISQRGRIHVSIHNDISRQTGAADRHRQHPCPDRRPHRRGFCRRPAADSRRGQAQPPGRRRLERRIHRQSGHRGLPCAARNWPQGTAAWLRNADVSAETLEGGFEGWKAAKLPLVHASKLPARDAQGRTVWVTRARPKIDRIACPWLIRRFVDPNAVFLFVAPSEVVAVGERFNATPFDIENVFWSHRGELCTFDVMVEEFGLATPPMLRLATMVRAADTGRLDLSSGGAGAAGGFARAVAHV